MASDKEQKKDHPQKPQGGASHKGDKGGGDKGEKAGKPQGAPKSDKGGGKKARQTDAGEGGTVGPRTEPRLQTRYKQHVAAALSEKFKLGNAMQRPRLTCIVLNVNMGRHDSTAKERRTRSAPS